jgi:hypothetical protein
MPERQTFLPKANVLSLEELHKLSLGRCQSNVAGIDKTR